MARKLIPLSDRRDVVTNSNGQISIRGLLWLTLLAAMGTLFMRELYVRFGPTAAFVAALAFLSIAAHVAGAAMGSRFRKKDAVATIEPSEDENGEPLPPKHMQPLEAKEADFAPATELSRQQPLNRRPIVWAIGIGASASATLASIILTLVMWDNLAIVNVLFGAFSAAVIGGLLGFWLSSFFQVVRSALSDAQKNL